jgi:hypothetical protein
MRLAPHDKDVERGFALVTGKQTDKEKAVSGAVNC